MPNKKKSTPFFSIIIPIRNEESRLRYCLPSLLKQGFDNFEIILVEDPETSDNTSQYISNLADDRIQYIIHKPGLRVPAKRNLGASKASGVYYYFIDADMEFPSGFLDSLKNEIIQSSPDLVFVSERTPGDQWLAKMKDFEKQIIQKFISLTAARVYRAEVFNNSHGYIESLVANEEMEISDRLISQGYNYVISESIVYHYETAGHNIIQHLKKKFKYGITVLDYYDKKGDDTLSNQRTGTGRLVYFSSPLIWRNIGTGLQFIIFKLIELGVLAAGLIYGYIFRKKVITTK